MNYYKGKHAILNETKKNANTPNNKIITNMCKYITDTATGYFLGQPIAYSSSDSKFMDEVQKIFDYNDEQDENAELAKWNSIYGSAVEMLYLDEDGVVRFTKVNPADVIFINETMYGAPLAAIRKIATKDLDGKTTESCEFWTSNEV